MTRVFQSGTVSFLVRFSASWTVLTRLSLAQSVPKVVPNADRHLHPPTVPWIRPSTQKGGEQAARRQRSNARPLRHCPLHQQTRPDRRMVAPTLLIDYFCRSYYILSVHLLLSYPWFLLFNISWGCGLVGTAAAAFAVSVSIVCMYALLSLGRHFVLSCLFNHPENHAFLCN